MLTMGIVGANGFVGSRAMEIFHLNREFKIVPIAHSVSGLARIARFNIDWRIADATDANAMTAAFQGCDVILHAMHGPLESIGKSPRATLSAAQRAGVRRIVYLSTASVHGQDPDPGTNESSPLHAKHPIAYNNAKVIAEREFLSRHKECGVELIALRPGIVFGPRDAWVSAIARALVDGRAFLVDGGHGFCNTIYVDNLVHAIRCASTTAANGEVFLVGDDEAITWREFYLRIASALGQVESILEIKAPTSFSTQRSAVDVIKGLPGAQLLLEHLPKGVKAMARRPFEIASRFRDCARSSARKVDPNPWVRPQPNTPQVSLETALLHRCRSRFDYSKARRLLQFSPPVSLDDGLARSIGWLEYIGYATHTSPTAGKVEKSPARNGVHGNLLSAASTMNPD